jgi:hypothetical protein
LKAQSRRRRLLKRQDLDTTPQLLPNKRHASRLERQELGMDTSAIGMQTGRHKYEEEWWTTSTFERRSKRGEGRGGVGRGDVGREGRGSEMAFNG